MEIKPHVETARLLFLPYIIHCDVLCYHSINSKYSDNIFRILTKGMWGWVLSQVNIALMVWFQFPKYMPISITSLLDTLFFYVVFQGPWLCTQFMKWDPGATYKPSAKQKSNYHILQWVSTTICTWGCKIHVVFFTLSSKGQAASSGGKKSSTMPYFC